jgi:hypothetical protein
MNYAIAQRNGDTYDVQDGICTKEVATDIALQKTKESHWVQVFFPVPAVCIDLITEHPRYAIPAMEIIEWKFYREHSMHFIAFLDEILFRPIGYTSFIVMPEHLDIFLMEDSSGQNVSVDFMADDETSVKGIIDSSICDIRHMIEKTPMLRDIEEM